MNSTNDILKSLSNAKLQDGTIMMLFEINASARENVSFLTKHEKHENSG
jgi:hypothetical protein